MKTQKLNPTPLGSNVNALSLKDLGLRTSIFRLFGFFVFLISTSLATKIQAHTQNKNQGIAKTWSQNQRGTLSSNRPQSQQNVGQTNERNQQQQKPITQQLDSLGQNAELMNLARSLDPQNRSLIVQERILDRHHAFELGVTFGAVAGGDAYFQTQNLGAQLEYHLTPRWSLGVRYQDHGNKLTPEGERIFAEARKAYREGNRVAAFPDIDTPQSSYFASLSWYPLYGKLNWFDRAVSHFDLYLVGGAGQMVLSSGPTSLMTAGGGVGFWFRSGISTRLEVRSQFYQDKDQVYQSSRSLNTTVGQFGVGYVF